MPIKPPWNTDSVTPHIDTTKPGHTDTVTVPHVDTPPVHVDENKIHSDLKGVHIDIINRVPPE